ncbi:hypothetical protein PHMEG_00023706 [Phytophthora megakarya]|uniref:Reverse transcriptase RNase H-like domain-containing protein n=1 Tax=Phytophthora megakarya TaxID=4795 RepID=A0A225VGF7_9STRA|nr:hypothetical protein PHMEG_00023706 [Phytophthora megakarya]
MPFGLKNAPQIDQRMIDNALYGFTRIPKSEDHGGTLDVFEDGEPVDSGKPSVLGRRSYIDDILIPANNWDQLCDRVEGFLEACDKWNLSISVVKIFWGMPKVGYLGHKVSQKGLEANPKDLSALTDLAFPGSLRAMQSFLGSLNYYSRFIEDYVIYADWAISGSLMQEYDQIYYPVMFASRTLKSNELNYGIAEKEVLALLRTLDLNYNALIGRPIHVLTRHSTLTWLFRSTALQGRLGQWAALLSPWTLEITKCVKEEDEILGSLAASIARSEVDKALISIAPKKEPGRKIQAPIPTIGRDEDLYVVSFDGSARVKRGLTVNEAEYHGLLLCLDLLEDLDPRRLVICGDSNLVIRQVRESDMEIQDLITLNRFDEILIVKAEDEIAQISAVTARSKAISGVRIGSDPDSLREEVVRELRIERVRQAQDGSWV